MKRQLLLSVGVLALVGAVVALLASGLLDDLLDPTGRKAAENRVAELSSRVASRLASSKVAPHLDTMALRLRLEVETLPPEELARLREKLRERALRETDPKRIQWELFLQYAGIRMELARKEPNADAVRTLEEMLAAFDSPEKREEMLAGVRDAFEVRLDNQEIERAQAAAILYGLALREWRQKHGALPDDISVARPDAVPAAMLGAEWRLGTDAATGEPALFLRDRLHPLFRVGDRD